VEKRKKKRRRNEKENRRKRRRKKKLSPPQELDLGSATNAVARVGENPDGWCWRQGSTMGGVRKGGEARWGRDAGGATRRRGTADRGRWWRPPPAVAVVVRQM
jgi:hypothetical protein